MAPDCGPDNCEFIVADVVTKAATTGLTRQIDVVFDGPPGPEAGRFVEVEMKQAIRCGSSGQTDIGG